MITEHNAIRSYARVSAKLKERIASGEFEIGTRLPPERELTISYNVSRPTIREAMIALEIEGIVSVRPGSGNYVISKRSRLGITVEEDVDVFDLLQARRIMESEACALAAPRICPEQIANLHTIVEELRKYHQSNDIDAFEHAERQFHLRIAAASGKAAGAAIGALWNMPVFVFQSTKLISTTRSMGQQHDFKKHNDILEALGDMDAEGARTGMRNYYTLIIDSILNDFESEEVERVRVRVKEQRDRYSV